MACLYYAKGKNLHIQRYLTEPGFNNDPYVTIHRIASDGAAHGIFHCVVQYAKSKADNVRIDTHENNLTMQHLIEKNGFVKCGTITVRDGSPRVAFQWVRNG